MKRTKLAASAASIALAGIAGLGGSATANNVTNTCTHGVANNNSGHDEVRYESSRNSAGTHIHKYIHNVFGPDHHPERNC